MMGRGLGESDTRNPPTVRWVEATSLGGLRREEPASVDRSVDYIGVTIYQESITARAPYPAIQDQLILDSIPHSLPLCLQRHRGPGTARTRRLSSLGAAAWTPATPAGGGDIAVVEACSVLLKLR